MLDLTFRMSEFERLLALLLAQVPSLTRDEVLKRIKTKKDRIGAGYLTDQGALYLIASDLGVVLELKERTKLLDQITIEEISKNDLDEKAKTLRYDKKRNFIVSNGITVGIMAGLFSITMILAGFNESDNQRLYSGIGILIVAVIITVVSFKLPIRTLNNKAIIFLQFYDAWKKIKEYKLRESNPDLDKYQKAVKTLANFVRDWIGENAPSDISDLPYSIKNNLRNKVVPLFEENSVKQIEDFIKLLEKMAMFTFTNEPSAQLLRGFNEEISEYDVIETKKVKEKKPLNILLTLGWISPVGGYILFYNLNQIDPTQIHASIGYSATFAAAIFAILAALMRRK